MSRQRDAGRRAADAWRTHAPPVRAPAQGSSGDRLRRLLHILPAAARDRSITIERLALELGVPEATILADVREVQERAYYLPPEAGARIQIWTEGGELRVWTAREFRRPVRLTPDEAAALSFGLRVAALSPSGPADAGVRDGLRARIEDGLAVSSEHPAPLDPLTPDMMADRGGIRRTLARAARDRAPCRILYVKAGAEAPEERVVHPYLIASAEGRWYAVAHCRSAGGTRYFRLDRVIDVERLDGAFGVPENLDPGAILRGSRIFHSGESTEAVIRYSGTIARRVAETSYGTWGEEGTYEVRRAVADPEWLVRHVLAFGGDAEVLGPPALRALVRDGAKALAAPPAPLDASPSARRASMP